MDAEFSGNEFRFLQHSHHPNVALLPLQMSSYTGMVVGVVSVSPLPRGKTELMINYSVFSGDPKFWAVCKCTSPKCTQFQSVRAFGNRTPEYVRSTSPYQVISPLISDPPVLLIRKFNDRTSPFHDKQSASAFFERVVIRYENISGDNISHLLPYILYGSHYYYLDTSFLPNILSTLKQRNVFLSALYDQSHRQISRFLALWEHEPMWAIFQVSLFSCLTSF